MAARLQTAAEKVPFITRTMKPLELLSEEGLELIEHNADKILHECGIDFRGMPEALPILEEAGGSFTDWNGRRAIDGGSAISTNGALLDAVLALQGSNTPR